MTTTPNDPAAALPGCPPVVDLATWQVARDEITLGSGRGHVLWMDHR
jgi:hypothetical protein